MTALTEKAMVVKTQIRGSSFGRTKSDKDAGQDVANANRADVESVRVVKTLVDKKYTETIHKIASEAYITHRTMTLPWQDDGVRLLPTGIYFEYMQKMRRYNEDYQRAVADLHANYENAKLDAVIRLGSLYRDDDYKDAGSLFCKHPDTGDYLHFSIVAKPRPISDGSDIRVSLNADEIKAMQDQIAADNQAAITEAVSDMWGRLKEAIENLRDRLTAYDNGDIKAVRESWVTNVREVAKLLPKLNFTGDHELDRLCSVAEQYLGSLNRDQLKVSANARATVRNAADELLSKMAGYVGDSWEEAA